MNYERREDRRRAAHFLLCYKQERESYEAGREQWLSRPADESGVRKGGISRPTETAALQGIEYDIRNPVYYWLRAVADVYANLPARKRLFLDLRRDAMKVKGQRRGRRAWISFIQARLPFYISDTAAKRWWSDIIEAVVDRQLRERLRISERKLFSWRGLAAPVLPTETENICGYQPKESNIIPSPPSKSGVPRRGK